MALRWVPRPPPFPMCHPPGDGQIHRELHSQSDSTYCRPRYNGRSTGRRFGRPTEKPFSLACVDLVATQMAKLRPRFDACYLAFLDLVNVTFSGPANGKAVQLGLRGLGGDTNGKAASPFRRLLPSFPGFGECHLFWPTFSGLVNVTFSGPAALRVGMAPGDGENMSQCRPASMSYGAVKQRQACSLMSTRNSQSVTLCPPSKISPGDSSASTVTTVPSINTIR